jgi:hypothetical protein
MKEVSGAASCSTRFLGVGLSSFETDGLDRAAKLNCLRSPWMLRSVSIDPDAGWGMLV